MDQLQKLKSLKNFGGQRITHGIAESDIVDFLETDLKLRDAIDDAYSVHKEIQKDHSDLLKLSEKDLMIKLQEGFVNFYEASTVSPYIPLAANGPWIVTSHGAVVHDSGGYGMLGFGHAPQKVLDEMKSPHVMANIMTPSFSQLKFIEKINKEIGHSRKDGPVYSKYICMNSGSESVTVAMRISDANAKAMTASGAKHAGKTVKILTLKGSFHGRTDRPAQASNSTFAKYHALLATFDKRDNLRVVEHNDIADLKTAFDEAEKNNVFYECLLMEPVQGEGAPGIALSREFYDVARELTEKTGTLLIMDSIQAGFRTQGTLSVVDYPGFQTAKVPDMETYSKAVNGGQYPLSVLALKDTITSMYKKGIYGNTMTTNPKALEVACIVLDSFTPELRKNIQDRGVEFVEKLKEVQKDYPSDIVSVQGTGLLFATELNPKTFKVVGFGEVEEYMRINGIGVIHGGANALRFTPHFAITSKEVDLMVKTVRQVMEAGPRH